MRTFPSRRVANLVVLGCLSVGMANLLFYYTIELAARTYCPRPVSYSTMSGLQWSISCNLSSLQTADFEVLLCAEDVWMLHGVQLIVATFLNLHSTVTVPSCYLFPDMVIIKRICTRGKHHAQTGTVHCGGIIADWEVPLLRYAQSQEQVKVSHAALIIAF